MFVVCMDHGGRPAGLKILLICLVKNVARNGDSNGLKKGRMILREIRYGLMKNDINQWIIMDHLSDLTFICSDMVSNPGASWGSKGFFWSIVSHVWRCIALNHSTWWYIFDICVICCPDKYHLDELHHDLIFNVQPFPRYSSGRPQDSNQENIRQVLLSWIKKVVKLLSAKGVDLKLRIIWWF